MPFQPGNAFASIGGRTRAQKLSAERRRDIARSGFEATTQKHFAGDAKRHVQWFIDSGLATQDANYPNWMRVWRKATPHPKHINDAIASIRLATGDVDFEDCRPNRRQHENHHSGQ